MELHNATGTYRLSAASCALLGATLLHLIDRNGKVMGRYGNRGYIKGSIDGDILVAALREGSRSGSMRIRFDANYRSFEGTFELNDLAVLNELSGSRLSSASSGDAHLGTSY
ncbi:MAG: hypothetical protein ABI282_03445 [Candidatus Baltobacteraceae bacterium]